MNSMFLFDIRESVPEDVGLKLFLRLPVKQSEKNKIKAWKP